MARKILNGKQARQKMLSGVRQLANTVTTTLGPTGRNVGIDHVFVDPVVLHDGVSVAKQIELPDPFENFAAQLVRQASAKTADKAGDGTTSSTLLAHAIIEEGMKALEPSETGFLLKKTTSGANPMVMKKGIDLAVAQAVKTLEAMSQKVTTKEQIANVATISAADKSIGEKIAEAMDKVGKDGVISVEEHAGMDIQVEYKEGMEFDKGFISPQFATNQEKEEATSEAPYILITDQVISTADEVGKFLKRFVEETNRMEIVLIATDITGPALATLLINKDRGGIIPLGIFAPGFAERRKDMLEDIAILTGGTVILKEKGMKIEDVQVAQLGRADRVESNDKRTKIVGGFGDAKTIEKRAQSIRDLIEKTDSDFEKEKLRERLARLISGAAIIKVGARTEVELADKKERVIDAVEATKSAVAEGIVPGGGIAYFNCIEAVTALKGDNPDMQKGIDIVARSLQRPLEKLLENAGYDPLTVIQTIANNHESNTYGFNVETGEYGDLLEMGIIDPTKVAKNAIQNGGSVAAMILTTDAIITNIPETTSKVM